MSSCTVAAIMTVRNGQSYLEQAIESVLNQTHSVCQFVIVDDGSEDETPHILSRMVRKDFRLKVISTPGVGRARALNLAWTATTAAWIANIDADDLWGPRKIERQLALLHNEPSLDFVATASRILRADSVGLPVVGGSLNGRDLPWCPIRPGAFGRGNPINHSSVLIRRKALDQVGGYAESLSSQIDYDLWIRLSGAGFSMAVLLEPHAGKRLHDGQSFEATNRLAYLRQSAATSLRAINELGLSRLYYAYVILRFAYGLVPARLRRVIRNVRSLSPMQGGQGRRAH